MRTLMATMMQLLTGRMQHERSRSSSRASHPHNHPCQQRLWRTPAATLVLRNASRSVVLPWSTCLRGFVKSREK